MPLKMKELPVQERPYEKLEKYGEKVLSNAELLAIIIKTGTKEENSIEIANRILLMSESLKGLLELSIEDLMNIKGIGKVKAIQLKALCELAQRMSKHQNSDIQIKYPKDVANLFMDEYKFEKRETLKLIILNNKNYIIKVIDIAKGVVNQIIVDIKEILKEVIKLQANKMIIVHNHPSGDATPSKKDIEFTKRLIKASKIMDIKLLDHIIIGYDKYESIFSRGDIKNEIVRL